MLRMAQIKYIKDLYENEEASLREICRITGHSFETVRKYAYRKTGARTICRILSHRAIRCYKTSSPSLINGWRRTERPPGNSAIQ